METVHYLILGGAAALVAAILFPGFRSKAKTVVSAAVAPAQDGSLKAAFKQLHDVAETLAYQRLEAEVADKRAGKLKAEIQEMFSFDATAATATVTKAAK